MMCKLSLAKHIGDVVVTSDADDLTRIAESLGRQLRIHRV
jgi:hypothetical protein